MTVQLGLFKTARITGAIFGLIGVSLGSVAVAQNNIVDSDGTLPAAAATITGQLKTRNYLITIYAGPNGPLYTVIDGDGNVKGVQMPPKLLAREFPVLKSIIENPADDASNFRSLQRNNIIHGESAYQTSGGEL